MYMEVANEIRHQLAAFGNFAVMIGASNFLGENRGNGALSFKFKAKGHKVAGKCPNWIRITLDADDTYSIEYGRIHGFNFDILRTVSGIYADQMHAEIETTTGLRLSLTHAFSRAA